ncbi:MAG: curlin repeat-containing protein [Balneolaceae bacterium]
MKTLLTFITALLFTVGTAFAQSNDASIDQVGDDHEATITQVGATNSASVEQTADAGREGDDIGTATVDQDGTGNVVGLRQRAFYGDAEATITQIGDNNRVDDFYQNHGLNLLDVSMTGNDNVLYGTQGESQKNANSLLLSVIGNSNDMGTFQHYGSAEVNIDGDYNEVLLSQRSSHSSTEQTANIDLIGSDNFVDVTQTGESHTANVDVSGSFNSATITQHN